MKRPSESDREMQIEISRQRCPETPGNRSTWNRDTERAFTEIDGRGDDHLARDRHRRIGRWTDPCQPLQIQDHSPLTLQLRALFGPVFTVCLDLTWVVVLCWWRGKWMQ
jgi:hypothetical protein